MRIPPSLQRPIFFAFVLIASLTLSPKNAVACQRLVFNDINDSVVRVAQNLDQPGVRFWGVGASQIRTYQCSPGQEAFLINMNLPGLTYEGEILSAGGVMAPAYSFGSRSPLLTFLFSVTPNGQTGQLPRIALRNGEVNRHAGVPFTATGRVDHFLQMHIHYRGGAMESVPSTFIGTIEFWPENDASNPYRHSFTLELDIPVVTCNLTDVSHSLDDARMEDLAASGSNAKESSFDVTMNCPMDNIDVQLSLADANDPGSSNGQLAPAPGATAGGVQVQLLRGGQPVQFGQAWSHGWSSKGQQAIPFSARYLRTADPLVPGDVKGEAVLTADYR